MMPLSCPVSEQENRETMVSPVQVCEMPGTLLATPMILYFCFGRPGGVSLEEGGPFEGASEVDRGIGQKTEEVAQEVDPPR
jgi:hypothetical protein